MSGMRILLVGAVAAGDGGRTTGGIASHVSDLASALSTAGHEVAVFADNLPASPPAQRPWGTLYTRAAGGTLALAAAAPLLARRISRDETVRELGQATGTALAYVLGLRRALAAHRPDVIHVHQADWRSLYLRLADPGAVPSVVTQHSLTVFSAPDGCMQTPQTLSPLARATIRGLRDARAAISVSEDIAEGLRDFDPMLDWTVISNGVDLSLFAPDPAGRDTQPLVAFVGRVSADKGAADLIAAVGMLAHRLPDVRLALGGPVQDIDPVALASEAGLAPDAIEILGPLTEVEVAELLKRSWVLANPSRMREGQSRVLLEAMAAQVPVVATRVGAMPALLQDGACGELVPVGDHNALSAALERAIAGGLEVAAQVSAAADVAAASDLRAITERVVEVYRSVTAG